MDVLTTEHKNLGSNPTINDRAVTSIELVIERLLTPGSIPKLAMPRYVLGKDI